MAYADLYERVRQKTPVPITERDLERVLVGLLQAESLWDLAGLCDVPLAALPPLLEELQQSGLLERRGDRLTLTPSGKQFIQEQGWTPPAENRCPRCRGRGISLEEHPYRGLLESFTEITRERPAPRRDFDQGYVTPETTIARVALMRRRGDLDGKRLLVLGDDDLMGLAAALVGTAKRITVLEVDPDLVAFIRGTAERLGLELDVREHDLRDPLPQDLLQAFDTFATDPVESYDGCRLFLGRGLSGLAGVGGAGYFGLTRHEASLAKWHKLQAWILEQGAVITDGLDRFNEYVNWPYWEEMRASRWLGVEAAPQKIWYRSTLFRLELVEPKAYPNEPFAGSFEDPELATT